MKKRRNTIIHTVSLLSALTLMLSGCSSPEYTDLMQNRDTARGSDAQTLPSADTDNISAQASSSAEPNGTADTSQTSIPESSDPEAAVTDFSVRLFQNSLEEGENTLISPLSVLFALSMTANGAQGSTLAQMETVLGMPVDQLNAYIHTYMDALPEADTYRLKPANSIWFTDEETFTVKEEFLQTNADYYNAGIYKVPFDDTALRSINGWVEDNTDGMIKNILDSIPDDAVMYLINALAFDAEWQEIYHENHVRTDTFTLEDGTVRETELMYSEESKYLEDDQAIGFLKYYDDRAYAFAALLPKEGISVADYVASLSGNSLRQLLTTPTSGMVNAAIPKFESEYSAEMSEILINMGMPDAFDGSLADFSAMGSSVNGNLAIDRVLHKTFISVDEKGTKAGAATAVEMVAESAIDEQSIKIVTLDRPFVYMLIDCEKNIPLFIGTMMDVAASE